VNILIGGTGFIGSELARGLVKRKEKVVSVAHDKGDIPNVEYIGIDLRAKELPHTLLDRAENVFILIGQIGPNFDAESEKRLLTKLVKPLSVGRQRVFFFSTVLVYGNRTRAANEESSCRPIGVYPQFKLDAEKIMHDLIPRKRLVTLRLANVYGSPKNRGFIGVAMKKIADPQDHAPISILGSGRQRRDYIFVDDVIGAVLSVKKKSGGSGIVNITTGKSYSLMEVLEILSKVAGRKIPYENTDKRLEADTIIVSNERLQKEFGYKNFIPLEEGLKKTLARYPKVKQ
jgi:UDP-glucose 4-epimerase